MSSQPATGQSSHVFPPTRWSLVRAAKHPATPESAPALESLCRAYWYPIYAYVRRSGQSAHDAQDQTQEFFFRLLEKRWLDAVDRDKGKLRTFLVVALRNFLNNEWRRTSAQRRGGPDQPVPFDAEFAESRYAADPAAALPAEDVFDREWALTLLEVTLRRLAEEFAAAGRSGDYEAMKGCLLGGRGLVDYQGMARALAATPGAARVAVHRLRRRFREIYREEIAQTLASDADLETEVRHLAKALARAQ